MIRFTLQAEEGRRVTLLLERAFRKQRHGTVALELLSSTCRKFLRGTVQIMDKGTDWYQTSSITRYSKVKLSRYRPEQAHGYPVV